jgi:leucyl-tRNA synthetase
MISIKTYNGLSEKEVRDFVERMRRQDWIKRTAETTEKEGVFTGAYCLNPMTKARMPIFVANFVGETNFFEGTMTKVRDDFVRLEFGEISRFSSRIQFIKLFMNLLV